MSKLEIAAVVSGAIGVIGGISCSGGGNQNQEVTPTPCIPGSNTQTPRSELTQGTALTKIPQIPCEYLGSWESAVGFLFQLKKDEGLMRLVQDKRGRIDVGTRGAFEGSSPSTDPFLTVIIDVKNIKDELSTQNPSSPPSQSDIKTGIINMKKELCGEISAAVSPLSLGPIKWNVTTLINEPGIIRDPLIDYGFTLLERNDFNSTPAECSATP